MRTAAPREPVFPSGLKVEPTENRAKTRPSRLTLTLTLSSDRRAAPAGASTPRTPAAAEAAPWRRRVRPACPRRDKCPAGLHIPTGTRSLLTGNLFSDHEGEPPHHALCLSRARDFVFVLHTLPASANPGNPRPP